MAYSIGQVAEKTGLSSYTLRYYDKEGLMPFVHRGNGGRREFTDDDMDFVDLISCLKQTGMSLKEIREFVNMSMEGNDTLEKRLEMFKRQRDEVMKQIEQSQRYLKKLDYKVKYFEAACANGSEDGLEEFCDTLEATSKVNRSINN
ncbi:MerR family transcriptional regulator [Companilactobacillus zhachilii]|jgi:Predicted transcriptional regulators|uniref:MerR family transcriptional regulator n=1 Tax=Companilactobacillus zhachilii TaxID=2304606 RepID=A0A386PVW6_9LACO|nr:MerR family transcriptional regulator [Companilactobacillus zhachilii]AYE38620.1 MerR family transcriptional regulator [Companilactobacillus zhachilii]MBL3529756.1 MerR family transcriptional regulator [Companilactobacillus zhachilii]